MADFWERGAHSVKHMFIALVVSHFGFEDGILVLIASIPSHCLPFPYYQNILQEILLCILVLSTVCSSISVPLQILNKNCILKDILEQNCQLYTYCRNGETE